ncbi:MAG: HAD family hydrolase [Clostridia bacterium]|nr:HAD family hydrolase [Clostridia bacterium]
MKKIFIFDLDGTILDTIHTIAYYVNDALSHFGFPENETKKYNYFAGNGATNLIHRALAAHGLDTEDNFNKVYPYYMEQYNKNTLYKTAHFKGLPETLKALKEKGIALAVVSNKPDSTVQPLMPKFFEEGLFDYIFGARENVPLKPDPATVNEVIRLCGVEKQDVVYVGDTGTDMQTGKNAGIFTVGVLWGFRDEKELLENGADVLIAKAEDLLLYI